MQRRLGPVLLIAALGVGVAGVTPAAAATTVVVAADGKASLTDCDALTSAPTSIQAAVDAAAPGTTIRVCPGSYKELVTVGAGKDDLTITAARPFAPKVRVPQGADAAALILVDGADRVTVRGLTLLAGSSKTCGQVTTGILVRDSLDSVVRGNRITATTTELRGPCSIAWGIAVGGTPARPAVDVVPPTSAFVGWNLVRDPLLGGIWVTGEDTSVTVRANSIRYWHLGSAPTRAARRASLRPAAIDGPVGITVREGADAVIERNAVSSGPDADPNAGGVTPVGLSSSTIVLPIGISATSAGTVRILDNRVLRVGVALSVAENASARITDNQVRDARVGIVADDAGARYLRNTVERARVGITALGDGQTLRDNTLLTSSLIDCIDETTGGGTLGTANTWSGNTGTVSYPIGICGSGAPDITVTFTASLGVGPAGGAPLRTPTSIVGTFPGSPVSLSFNGLGGYEATVDLPLGGSYSYDYRDQFGPVEECRPPRVLLVVNEGGLRMSVEDTLELEGGISSAVC